jgi:hypothetical protein
MSKLFMPEVSAEQRKLLLQQNADSIEQTDYLKPLSPDELDIKREILTENAIKLSELEDEKKEAMQEFKSQMDPLAKANKELLTEIKTRQAKFFGHLYHMANHEDGMMETYDDNGELVASRRLRPEERRQNLFCITKSRKSIMENLNIKIENPAQELIIREGQALAPVAPEKIRINGNINAVRDFLSVRNESGFGLQTIDVSKALVIVNKKDLTIRLQLDPENHYGAEVLAKLEYSEEIKPFCINQPKTFTREELIKLIRFNKMFFDDSEKQDVLLKSYMAFNASAHSEMAQASDTRGNKTNNIQKTVNTNVPTEFILNLPVFKGEAWERFRVEICLDVTDGGARFWFESVELNEMIQQRVDEIFTKQLAACTGFVIINQ